MAFRSFLLALLGCIMGLSVHAQHTPAPQEYKLPRHILSIKPQGLILSMNLQLESTLSPTLSVQNELYLPNWNPEWRTDMVALASNLKWYFAGEVGNGMYLRAKLIGGKILEPNELWTFQYFAGGGIGLGVQRPIGQRWFYGFDLGIKLVAPFDERERLPNSYYTDRGGHGGFYLLSPASVFDVAFSIGYRLK
ncbi:MAG: hypothetical protein Q4D66_05840 [Bacteroidales bacterium]|nr:hypothetical protein [Bacteroidales bacterium]